MGKWFHENRELFTQLTFKGTNDKPKLEDMKGFLKILHAILRQIDNENYATSNDIKIFLTDFIKYAPRALKKFQNKNE